MLTDSERFLSKVIKTESCWLWQARINPLNGYGKFRMQNRHWLAHRAAWTMFKGPIPKGLTIDHLCRVRNCVNPAHLEPVTQRENILRGNSMAAQCMRTNRCSHGHEFTEENTRIGPNGQRYCRECCRNRAHKSYLADPVKKREIQRLWYANHIERSRERVRRYRIKLRAARDKA